MEDITSFQGLVDTTPAHNLSTWGTDNTSTFESGAKNATADLPRPFPEEPTWGVYTTIFVATVSVFIILSNVLNLLVLPKCSQIPEISRITLVNLSWICQWEPSAAPRPYSGTPSIFRYPVHIQAPRPYSGTPSIFRYPVHIQAPRPYSGTPSIFRYPVHIQVPRPYSGTPSIFRNPSIFRHPVHIQVPRPYSGTPSIFRYPVHIQVPRPYSGTPSIFRYPVHILRGGGVLAVRGCLLPDLRYIPQRGRGRVRLESLFGRP